MKNNNETTLSGLKSYVFKVIYPIPASETQEAFSIGFLASHQYYGIRDAHFCCTFVNRRYNEETTIDCTNIYLSPIYNNLIFTFIFQIDWYPEKRK